MALQEANPEINDTLINAVETELSPSNPEVFKFSGSIDLLDVDLFEVELDRDSGGVLLVDIDATNAGSNLDSYVRIFDEEGTQVQFNDNIPNLNSRFSDFRFDASFNFFPPKAEFSTSEFLVPEISATTRQQPEVAVTAARESTSFS